MMHKDDMVNKRMDFVNSLKKKNHLFVQSASESLQIASNRAVYLAKNS